MFARDEETAFMLRDATQRLDAGDGDGAINCLLAARDSMMKSDVSYSVQTWCKLPLYYSRLGRFDEAMDAFDWLLEDLPRRAQKESFMDDLAVSFGEGTTKKSVYSSIIRTGKAVIERNRQVVLRRVAKAEKALVAKK